MKWYFIFAVVLLASCGGHPTKPTPPPSGEQFVIGNLQSITRFHDDEKSVTCWVYAGYQEGGIDCIPDKDIDHGH